MGNVRDHEGQRLDIVMAEPLPGEAGPSGKPVVVARAEQ